MNFSFKRIAVLLLLAGLLLAGFFWYKKNYQSEPHISENKILHYSYFSQKQFFDDAYSRAGKLSDTQNTTAQAILVNHHLLAPEFIAEAFNKVATTANVTVLLISPNHFSAGRGQVISSLGFWQTPYGELEPDTSFINRLSQEGLVSVEEEPFIKEHGVSGIVPFIKKSLPNAKVVPLIFNSRMNLAEALEEAKKIKNDLPNNILAVGSIDISHYLTSNAADFHDISSLWAVENLDAQNVYRLDVDSKPGMAFYLNLVKSLGVNKFNLLEHTNSSKVSGQDLLENTSYITGYFTFADNSLANTNQLQTLLSLGKVSDVAQISSSLDRQDPKFALEYLERLLYGQNKTVVQTNQEIVLPKILTVDGVNNQVTPGSSVQLGNVKISYVNSNNQTELRNAIDQGADIVIGQSSDFKIEQYKNKLIFYGQGDFLTLKSINQDTNSLGLGMIYVNHQLSIYLLPIRFSQGVGKLLINKASDILLLDLSKRSLVEDDIKTQIKQGLIQINNFK